MYNKTIMVGNLTRDIELKYLPSGSAVAKVQLLHLTDINRKQESKKKKFVF